MSSQLSSTLDLDYDTVSKLAQLPLESIHIEYPNKLNQVLHDESEVLPPSKLHPTFFGCFDWHSSVHGHWLLAKVCNLFPGTPICHEINAKFETQFTEEKIVKELAYFKRREGKSFERTYGWAWLLKLQMELENSETESLRRYSKILKPLSEYIVDLYIDYLPQLCYPVRVGEHHNLAFGLIFALEFARHRNHKKLLESITAASKSFYMNDVNGPLAYEPSGYDFLSPCFVEAELMSMIISGKDEFEGWLKLFLPQLFSQEFDLEPGQVRNRTDGKLVHLDGLNFSRAWALYNIAQRVSDEGMQKRLVDMADKHVRASIDSVVGSDYAGSHWLASFLLHALEVRSQMKK